MLDASSIKTTQYEKRIKKIFYSKGESKEYTKANLRFANTKEKTTKLAFKIKIRNEKIRLEN